MNYGRKNGNGESIGNRMITSVRIKNFRCFREVNLRDCRNINVIVGENASGKTAILEAMYLAAGQTPELALRIRKWRGYDVSARGDFDQIDEAIWSDLFRNYDLDNIVSVDLKGTDVSNRTLKISWKDREIISPVSDDLSSAGFTSAIEFRWMRKNKKIAVIRPQFSAGKGFTFFSSDRDKISASFFSSAMPYNVEENVRHFSKMKSARKESFFINAMKTEFPFISGIEVLSHCGVSMLHADISSLPHMIPLSAVSSGVSKLSALLLAMSEHYGGALLVDEIENGFHYSIMESIWRTLYEFSSKNNVQIFASTHSAECLEALANATVDNPSDVTLIRTSIDSDGGSNVEQFIGVESAKYGELR